MNLAKKRQRTRYMTLVMAVVSSVGASLGCMGSELSSPSAGDEAEIDRTSAAVHFGKKVLILATTLRRNQACEDNLEARIAREVFGLEPECVDHDDWEEMTTADFGSYRAIVFADPDHGDRSILDVATANHPVWSSAITGNVILIGSDPAAHAKTSFIERGLQYATANPTKTGLYVSLSEYYQSSQAARIDLLQSFGEFVARAPAPSSCHNLAHRVLDEPQLVGLTTSSLSNWQCSVHEVFERYPADFKAFAIARNDTGAGNAWFTDPNGSQVRGTPYILVRNGERDAPACSEFYPPGRNCAEIVAQANSIAERAMNRSNEHFTRAEYIRLFDAVECKTGVPAWMMRAYSFEEALGHQYENPYPRQYFEPCEQAYMHNSEPARQWAPGMWKQYYGLEDNACPESGDPWASFTWPLLGLYTADLASAKGPNRDFRCTGDESDCRPRERLPIASRTLVGTDGVMGETCQGSTYQCERVAHPSGELVGVPPASRHGEWGRLWEQIIHVTLGDDTGTDEESPTAGLGVMQVTLALRDIVRNSAGNQLYFVHRNITPSTGDVYPHGIDAQFAASVPFPLAPQQDRLVEIVKDPQYNVLVAAQMVAMKRQQDCLLHPTTCSIAEQGEFIHQCEDSRYGSVVAMHPALTRFSEEDWICYVGSLKASSGNCSTGQGQTTIRVARDRRVTDDPGCFCLEEDNRTPADCRFVRRHAFAFGCSNFDAYCTSSIPASDPCHPARLDAMLE